MDFTKYKRSAVRLRTDCHARQKLDLGVPPERKKLGGKVWREACLKLALHAMLTTGKYLRMKNHMPHAGEQLEACF